MRRALATATLAGAVALVPLTAVAAAADETPVAAGSVIAQQDGDDDTGKYGLIGLSGLFGLFGYKKYKDHRAAQTTTATATDGTSSRV